MSSTVKTSESIGVKSFIVNSKINTPQETASFCTAMSYKVQFKLMESSLTIVVTDGAIVGSLKILFDSSIV